MTALHQYSQLEAAGLWRSDPQAQARDVVVGLRKATIVLLDPKSEMPLTQWSLPAIQRLAQAEGKVTYTPHPDGHETLELDDATMIAALERVRTVLERRRKRPGRLRSMAMGASLVVALAACIAWVPLRLYDFTAQRLPDAVRREISAMVLRDLSTISGSACARPSGLEAAHALAHRLAPQPPRPQTGAAAPDSPATPRPGQPPEIIILREGLTVPTPLPDGTILLPYAMVEQLDDPDTLAGLVLAARESARQADPVQGTLRYAGIAATFRLLSSGALPEDALQGYAMQLIQQPATPLPDQSLLAAFAQVQITPLPYASFAMRQGLTTLPRSAPQQSDPPVLDDAAFLALQYICDP